MNSILILIITYILNPILETSAGICAVKSMNHRSLRPTPRRFLLLSRHHIGRTARSF